MKLVGLSLGLTLLAGCATSGVSKFGREQLVSGENGDLRVFVDHACPRSEWLDEQWRTHVRVDRKAPGTPGDRSPWSARGVGGFAVEALSYIGSLAFQSFGTFLQKAGEAGITQSYGETGGYFYTERASAGIVPDTGLRTDISPEMRCIYLVRNGFTLKPSQFDPSAPEDLRKKWTALGLNKTPDFFGILHLETTADAELVSRLPGWLDDIKSAPVEPAEGVPRKLELTPSAPYFRAKLDRLYVREFQDPQAASSYRDLAIVLNYDLAGSSSKWPVELTGAGRLEPARQDPGVLAAGGVRVFGMRQGDYRESMLVGLQTGWMRMPPLKNKNDDNPRGALDLSVYVVESTPGNPLLQAIGNYLAGEPVRTQAESALKEDLGK